MVMAAEECAEACTADPLCNLAAYFTVAPGGQDMVRPVCLPSSPRLWLSLG